MYDKFPVLFLYEIKTRIYSKRKKERKRDQVLSIRMFLNWKVWNV